MNNQTLVLLVEDNPGDARLLRETLADSGATHVVLEHVQTVNAARQRLQAGGVDLVLLDLSLPDAHGLDTVIETRAAAPLTPIVVLTGLDDQALALRTMQQGAQDYLVKGQIDGPMLLRSIRYAIERGRIESDLRDSRHFVEQVAATTPDIIYVYDLAGRQIVYANRTFAEELGHQPGALAGVEAGAMPLALVHPDDRDLFQARLRRFEQAENDDLEETEYRVQDATGGWRWMHSRDTVFARGADGRPRRILGVARDITERKRLEEHLRRQAFYDVLTGLPNRALFLDRLGHALAGVSRRTTGIALLFLDLDGFKLLNDGLGHAAGDALLIGVADRLVASLRPFDTVARFGGDEFTVLLEEIATPEDALMVANRLIAALRAPFLIDDHHVVMTASIGVVPRPAAAAIARPDDLLRDADRAMYQAKAAGKGRAVIFDQHMAGPSEPVSLLGDLRHAVERGELRLHYQPEMDLVANVVTGVEALVRWQHPTEGLIPPVMFIPLAEQTGLILGIGRWVLREACRQAQAWRQLGVLPPLLISVNISPQQLVQPDFVDQVTRVLADSGLPADSLRLEITESTLMRDSEETMVTLRALKSVGVQLAIDDFGTGYSSLSYLRRFPVDTLKVDRSFVREMTHDGGTSAIVSAITALARTLHMSVTAEGIETSEQLAAVRAVHCRTGQGFYFSKPLPASEFQHVFMAHHGVQASA